MKKFILIAVLAGVMAALLASTALAAGPVNPPAQPFGRGMGAQTPCADCLTPGVAGAMRRGAPAWAGQPEEVATLLGMTAEQIRAERLAGKSLAQIAASKGISQDTLIAAILDAKKAVLAGLVAEGKLTQAQADLMVQHMQTQVKVMVERTSVGPAFGQSRPGTGLQGRGGMGQGFRGGRGANR